MAKISTERKATYYIGLGMIGLGFLLFISVFVSVAGSFGSSSGLMMNESPPFMNAVIGMILMMSGGLVSSIGAKGAAGSGLILDPEKAREDLKPFNEAKGGMISDVIDHIDVVDKLINHENAKEIIKIKCRSCGSLNDEDAKFCKACGKVV